MNLMSAKRTLQQIDAQTLRLIRYKMILKKYQSKLNKISNSKIQIKMKNWFNRKKYQSRH